MKYIITLFFAIITSITFVSALQITEVMYNPKIDTDQDNEWIEIYNDSTEEVDIKNYKVYDSGQKRDIVSSDSVYTLLPDEYAIVVRKPEKFIPYYSYSGKIFSSTFSFSNTSGELLKITDGIDGPVIFEETYIINPEADKTGKTVNFPGSIVCDATPGAAMSGCVIGGGSDTGNSNGGSSATSSATTTASSASSNPSSNTSQKTGVVYHSSRVYSLGDLSILVPREIETVAGQNTSFNLQVLSDAGKVTDVYWSYGDGGEGKGVTSTHRYKWPDVYTAFIEANTADAYGIDQIRVRVYAPDISITEVVNDTNGLATRENNNTYVTIRNNSDVDLDIGEFVLSMNEGIFPLSRHLLLPARGTLRLSGETLGFVSATNVRLLFNNKNVVTSFTSAPPAAMSIQSSMPSIDAITPAFLPSVPTSIAASPIVPILPQSQVQLNVGTRVQSQSIVASTASNKKLKTFTAHVVVPGTISPVKQNETPEISQKGADNKIETVNTEAPKGETLKIATEIKPANKNNSFFRNWFYWLYE